MIDRLIGDCRQRSLAGKIGRSDSGIKYCEFPSFLPNQQAQTKKCCEHPSFYALFCFFRQMIAKMMDCCNICREFGSDRGKMMDLCSIFPLSTELDWLDAGVQFVGGSMSDAKAAAELSSAPPRSFPAPASPPSRRRSAGTAPDGRTASCRKTGSSRGSSVPTAASAAGSSAASLRA